MKRRTLLLTLTGALFLVAAAPKPATLTERERALHVLNRLGFGPRPGDVDRVVKMGVERYIAQQLEPARLDDSAVDSKLARYAVLKMSDHALFEQYLKPQIERRRARRQQKEGEEPEERMRAEGRRVIAEISSARIERAISSNRQLNEVMVDFWMNHFNVFAAKGADRVLIVSYERDTIRPRIWGNFEDLLLATAKSPAMLFYLDNVRSIAAPENRSSLAMQPRRRSPNRQQGRGGLNENYARELLELHTLGVDGGYTQQDVTELARVLTGWSMTRPEEGGMNFVFRSAVHDTGSKRVLGMSFRGNEGIREGEAVIRMLARHPSTAKHIATKLCQRLVADEPPPQLVDRVAKRFLATNGDLRETVRVVITSPEFFDARYFRAKVKTPFEYVTSAIRAVDGQVINPLPLAKTLRDMGQPLYLSQPPTGYSDEAEAWVNSGALLNRMNFALALASSSLPGVNVRLAGSANPSSVGTQIVGGELSPTTRKTINERLEQSDTAPDKQLQLVAGLVLGSPEFQRQ